MSEVIPLASIKPDDHNANRHTERGTYMLRRSLERFGFLEPGVIDKNGRIIGGNNRAEAAADVLDADEAIVIDIDGTRPVFVRRNDLDLTTPEGREAAIALNRTAQVGIEFDAVALGDIVADGVDLGDWFQTAELAAFTVPGGEEWGDAFASVPDGERAPFQQMTFTLHDDQVETVKQAISMAKALGPFVDAPNENGNGNALARITELFLVQYGQG